MGYTKPTETTKQFLENSPLPKHGASYTVIPHKDVIKHTHDLLTQNGFVIEKELYRANMNAQVAQGIYYIKSANNQLLDNEGDIGIMFAWTNSYDKSTRFQCAIGGYVFVCNNGLVSGDMANFARKHTGNADSEVKNQISSQVLHANKFFTRLVMDKDTMKQQDLTIQQQAELLGRLFVEEKLIDVTQLSCVKNEIEKPSYDYSADKENAWTFYNHVTLALKKSHPRTWLSDQYKFHDFMTSQVLSQMGLQQTDINDTDSVLIPSENEADAEMQEMKTDQIAVEREAEDNTSDSVESTTGNTPYSAEEEDDVIMEEDDYDLYGFQEI